MDGGGVVIFRQRVFTGWRREGTVYLAEPGGPETALGQGKTWPWHAVQREFMSPGLTDRWIELRVPDAPTMTLSNDGASKSLAALL